jgi:hypothetical protein
MARMLKPCPDYVKSLRDRYNTPYVATIGNQLIPTLEFPYLNESMFITNTVGTATSLNWNESVNSPNVRGVIIGALYDINLSDRTYDKTFMNSIALTSCYLSVGGFQFPDQPITGAGNAIPWRAVQNSLRYLACVASSEKYRGQNINEYQPAFRTDDHDRFNNLLTDDSNPTGFHIFIPTVNHGSATADGIQEASTDYLNGVPSGCQLTVHLEFNNPNQQAMTWYMIVIYNNVVEMNKEFQVRFKVLDK